MTQKYKRSTYFEYLFDIFKFMFWTVQIAFVAAIMLPSHK